MFTLDSELLRLRVAIIGVAVALVGLLNAGLLLLSQHIESTQQVYPFKYEGRLRYLLPTLWPDHGKPLLLITGASTAREGLSASPFAAAFPEHRAYQGSFSLSTLSDLMASLEYVEDVYGARALPAVMVVGASPRFLAEVPNARPFGEALERYSRYYRVSGRDPTGFGLLRKSFVDGAVDHGRFLLLKQRPRYRTSLAWVGTRLIGPELSASVARSAPMVALANSSLMRGSELERPLRVGLYQALMEFTDPKYMHGWTTIADSQVARSLDDPKSFWRQTYLWDPAESRNAVLARAAALRAFAKKHDIEMYVVNLPERSISLARYRAGATSRYESLLRSAFADVPILDVRCALPDELFGDAEHPIDEGARIETDFTIEFMMAVRAARRTADRDPEALARVRTLSYAHRCSD